MRRPADRPQHRSAPSAQTAQLRSGSLGLMSACVALLAGPATSGMPEPWSTAVLVAMVLTAMALLALGALSIGRQLADGRR